ncbi:hypothetical protein EJD97_011570 [Solanum chilense]|uniref:Uncharacterized protein n=1 Tax=Solanum chilense TaxID=4083 RepID=A0A6N2BES8_SOLCI|nr:hypothetical protein EJD97_011570 [Solanum chilense]
MRRFLRKNYRKVPPTEVVTVVMLVRVRRWHRSAAAEERWGSLTKCGVTECVTIRHTYHRSHDGPSCWFVMKIKEVVPVPKFQEFKCFGTETLDGPLCL